MKVIRFYEYVGFSSWFSDDEFCFDGVGIQKGINNLTIKTGRWIELDEDCYLVRSDDLSVFKERNLIKELEKENENLLMMCKIKDNIIRNLRRSEENLIRESLT